MMLGQNQMMNKSMMSPLSAGLLGVDSDFAQMLYECGIDPESITNQVFVANVRQHFYLPNVTFNLEILEMLNLFSFMKLCEAHCECDSSLIKSIHSPAATMLDLAWKG